MPTLTATNLVNPPRKSGPPPDLWAALKLLFCFWEQRTGESAPTPGWFLVEAFSAMQQRNYGPSAIQDFLQSLLGPSYSDATSMETYYMTVVFAMLLKGVYSDQLEGAGAAAGTCRWCLIHWGIREGRDQIDHVTKRWWNRVLEVWRGLPAGQGPNEIYENGHRLLDVMRIRGPKLVKKIQGILRNE